ncbi:LOB domain-containing protein 36-like [Ananas comosus]|uniref:LOB domain-containing protein 36-like n=1 Tax=Ananas comosus TaxID=4615 RepID=A0A6P5F7Q3_ANACO|nr:LOB domain-containing protein 36-like [Ananas comosus]XP_020091637.1 LOB domain-containing protein 36-like [Ananas comosus]
MSSSSNSPCAACKFLRRKCTQGCVFAPYFPPDQPNKFACVHRVFGASNVAKLLNDISPAQREDAVNSLAYEADARLKDPVYGCVAYISLLELRLRQLRVDLHNAKKELAAYIGPAAFGPFLPSAPAPPPQFHHPQFQPPMMGLGLAAAAPQLMIRDHSQSQSQSQMVVDAQPMVVVAAAASDAAQREQEMFRTYDQQQQQEELARLSSVYDARGVYNHAAQLGGGPTVAIAGSAGGLSLLPPQAYDGAFTTTNQQQQQPQQLMLEHHQRAGSDEGRSGIGPSS